MTKTGFEFRILVIVICLIFDICDLEFLFLQYFSIPKELATFNGKAMQLCPPHKMGTVRLFSDEFFYCCQ